MLITDLFCYFGGFIMISLTICGYNSHHPKPCDIEHPIGLSDYLLLFVKTKAWFVVDKKHQITKPNMVILFDKNTYVHYGCNVPGYNDDWIHFDINKEEEDLLSTLSIPLNQPIYNVDIHSLSNYTALLTNAFHSSLLHTNAVVDSLMHALLYALSDELNKTQVPNHSHKFHSTFVSLRTNLYNSPDKEWSALQASDNLEISLSYFQHLYKDFFGCSFQQDVIHARITYAKFFLRSSNMSICDLSAFCGYHNELHFMRQFKKSEGVTPSEFRNNYKF